MSSPAEPRRETAAPLASARRPVPQPDDRSAGYWAAIGEGHLAVQRCVRCRRWQHPPVAACETCRSVELAFEDVSGAGVVHQRVVVHRTKLTGFELVTPYAAATIELVEQQALFVVGNVVGVAPDQVEIGQHVHVVFVPTPDGLTAQFTPDGAAA